VVLDGNVPPEAWTNGGRPNSRLGTYLRLGSDKAAARTLPAFLRSCGQRGTRACAFSAGGPAATAAKWDTLLGRLRKAPINLGGTAYTYAEVVTEVSFALGFVQPFSTPLPGNNFPGWSGAAQGLQQRLRPHRIPQPEQLRQQLHDRLLPYRRPPPKGTACRQNLPRFALPAG
jgi:hypothetical protein